MQNENTGQLKRWLRAFIPRFIAGGVILWVYDLMRFAQRVFHRDYSFHDHENEIAFSQKESAIQKMGGFIEDQGCYTDMFYGKTLMRDTGCEIIATYNAMRSMLGSAPISLAKLIHEFERDGIALKGKAGSAPKAIQSFFLRSGYDARMITKKVDIQRLADAYETWILTMYNDKENIMKQIHTVNISKTTEGYLVHNVKGDGHPEGPYDTLEDLIEQLNKGKAKMISLLGIRQK